MKLEALQYLLQFFVVYLFLSVLIEKLKITL